MLPKVLLTIMIVFGSVAKQDQAANYRLTEEQEGKVRMLVRRTQAHQAKLKEQLAKEQEKLSQCYTSFELNDHEIDQTHKAITDIEHKLLTSHFIMQKELRSIVGPEIFKQLAKRLQIVMEKLIPPVTK